MVEGVKNKGTLKWDFGGFPKIVGKYLFLFG